MALDKVTICNMALSNVGSKSTIEDINEATAGAKICKLWYDAGLTRTLEAYDWNFARKRLTLALHSDPAPTGVWEYRYQYPQDCVKFRKIENYNTRQDAVNYAIEAASDGSKSIVTNFGNPVMGVYTFLQTDISTYSLGFVTALAHAIASYIALSLTGKLQIQQLENQMFGYTVGLAAAESLNEEGHPAPRDADWIEGRGYYDPYRIGYIR